MNYSANIIIDSDCEDIEKLFIPEEKEFPNKRASFSLRKDGEKIFFQINAADATSLRAMLNSITKNLSIYEKTKWIAQPKKN